MKTKSFIFFLLTLVSFLSCDPPVPRPDRNPVASTDTISTVTVNGEELVLATTVGNKTVEQSECFVMLTGTGKVIYGQLGNINDENWGDWVLITKVVNDEAITSFYYKSVNSAAENGKLIANLNTTSWLICGKGDFIIFPYGGSKEPEFIVNRCSLGICELSHIENGVEKTIAMDKYNLGKIIVQRYLGKETAIREGH